MPNQLSFEVEFSRSDIEDILSDQNVTSILISGTYVHDGGGQWTMEAIAEGLDSTKSLLNTSKDAICIRPCP